MNTQVTNISIFDREYLIGLFGGREYPDGSLVIDYVEELIDYQKAFMRMVSKIRSETMMTFPVLTYSLLYQNGKFVDEEFARWCNKHNMNWCDSNFFVGNSVTTLSNCPLSPDTKIVYWSDYYQQYKVSPIKELYYNNIQRCIDSIRVISCGKEVECRINKFDISPNYEIELVNGTKIKTTDNHLNKVLGKDYVQTKDLTEEDYLPVSLIPYEKTKALTYEEGKIVGMFLGDGSYSSNVGTIVFSLNPETDKDDIEFLYDYCTIKYNAYLRDNLLTSEISGNKSCVNVSVKSVYLRGLIEQFVEGDNALNKSISPRVLSCSIEFRRGILDGLYTTDGGNSNRIYTSSVNLKDSLVLMLASMGIPSTVDEDSRDSRLGKNTSYTIRWYTPEGRTQRKGVYKIEDNMFWFKVKSVNKIKTNATTSFCLEVLDKDTEPVFMLPSGILTHNCRLLNDTTKVKASGFINSIGGTSLKIGSVKVSTINLRRVALESGSDKNKFFKILKDMTILDIEVLDTVRHIITRNIEKGLLPQFNYGLMNLDTMYNTIGVTSLYECVEEFGGISEDEFGNKYYTEDGLNFAKDVLACIREVKESYDFDYSINIEAVPAESANVKLCYKDNILYPDKDRGYFIYSNQWVPLMQKCTLQEKIRLGAVLDKACEGGVIAHINLSGDFSDEEQAWTLLNYIASQGVIYFAYNKEISVCEDEHAFFGDVCPKCGKPKVDSYCRVVGFLTPRSSYSKERKREFDARQWFTLKD